MRPAQLSFVSILVALIAGCGGIRPRTAAKPSPAVPTNADDAAPQQPWRAPSMTDLPAWLPVLGGPCEASAVLGVCVLCAAGRVVLVTAPSDMLSLPPGSQVGASKQQLLVDRGRLLVRQITCSRCRRIMGWTLIAALDGIARLPDGVRARVQGAVGAPWAPLLAGESAWNAAPLGTTALQDLVPDCHGGIYELTP